MADNHTIAQRHVNMAAIHSSSTKPELNLRHALWRLGFRYRVNDKSLPGKPDIVLPKYRTVIFVHGCFWHGHKDCKKYTIPKSNIDYWTTKIARNQQRDQDSWRQLEAKGWNVIIVWECELKKKRIQDTIDKLSTSILNNGVILRLTQEERQASRLQYQTERKYKRERDKLLKEEVNKKFSL